MNSSPPKRLRCFFYVRIGSPGSGMWHCYIVDIQKTGGRSCGRVSKFFINYASHALVLHSVASKAAELMRSWAGHACRMPSNLS